MKALHRLFAAVAALAGLLSAVAGTPQPAMVSDEVAALTLAEWIHDRKPNLVLVDLRSDNDQTENPLPGAQRTTAIDARMLSPQHTVVVYAQDAVTAEDAAAMRSAWQPATVLRLHGGLTAWNAQVLFPTLRSDASTRQQQAFAQRAQLSRYFGGSPRVLDPGEKAQAPRSRRGC